MRKLLDGLYALSGWLAGAAMVGVLLMVTWSIIARLLGIATHFAGTYAGFFMAAASFLALACALKRGEHIRVTLVVHSLKGKARKAMEVLALFVATLLSGFMAYYAVQLVVESYEFNELSTGMDATPLWIPQLAMAVGTLVFFIAFVDELILEIRDQRSRPKMSADEQSGVSAVS